MKNSMQKRKQTIKSNKQRIKNLIPRTYQLKYYEDCKNTFNNCATIEELETQINYIDTHIDDILAIMQNNETLALYSEMTKGYCIAIKDDCRLLYENRKNQLATE